MLLTQALDASISIVYLTQELLEEAQPRLIPIAAYPELVTERDRPSNQWRLPPSLTAADTVQPDRIHQTQNIINPDPRRSSTTPINLPPGLDTIQLNQEPHSGEASLVEQRQIVLPLVFEDNVLGLLVTRRDDRSWDRWEQAQVEEIAKTLAIAYVMDQRYLWEQHEREHERLLHLQQHDLMDNLLHQFRNSLTALQTFGKLILRRLAPGDRTQELATSITREADRLRDLAQQMEAALATGTAFPQALPSTSKPPYIDEEQLGEATLEPRSTAPIPTIALLPGGELPLDRCLLETILEPLLASAQAIAQEKGLTLEADLSEDLPAIWANAKALREALNNLIENAIKYTPAPGRVSVVAIASDTSDDLEIAISDTGVGIPPQDLPHLFQRHFRGVQAEGTIPGSGLGLAITRSLIEQMHGKIQVFSPALTAKQTPGSLSSTHPGTTFLVRLPIAHAHDE